MPYSTRSCTVVDVYTLVVCYVIQCEYLNIMVSVDVDTGCRVKFSDSKGVTKKPESSLCMGKVSHRYDVVSISVI